MSQKILFSVNCSRTRISCTNWKSQTCIALDWSKKHIDISLFNPILMLFHKCFPLFSIRCGVEVRLWRAIQNHRKQFKNITEDITYGRINHAEDINRNNINAFPSCPTITYEPSSPIRRSASGSHTNSYDSTSKGTISSDDYESCNGGTASDDWFEAIFAIIFTFWFNV